jgi:hypothetical protein
MKEHHGLPFLELDGLREGGPFAGLDVVGDGFEVLEGAVLHPDLAGLAGDAQVGGAVFGGERQDEAVDVFGHGVSPV